MDKFLWLLIMVPVSTLLTGIGIFALRRQKPMWFWSSTEVRAEEIADVPAYNRANGVMWIAYSAVFWLSTLLGLFDMRAAGCLLLVWAILGSILLIVCYLRIYEKYRVKK